MGGKSSKNEEKIINEEEALDSQFIKLKNSEILPIIRCEYINNNKKKWKIVFTGSHCSPYDDGYFILELLFEKGPFPKFGPEAKFITKMFHPNIDEKNGHVCINILNDWDPKTTIEDVILGILEIMDNPVPDGGYSNEAKKLLETNVDEFYKRVEEYTAVYANKGF